MIPENVLSAVYEQLAPLVHELAKYDDSSDASVIMRFNVGTVTFDFKGKKNEDNN